MNAEQGPLQGLVVLDLTTNLASAYTSLLFADYGAEVVQVEPPGGSRLRTMAAWPFWLRGKKSIVLDLHDPSDADVARVLAQGSDVVVEAFGPGVVERLSLDEERLRRSNAGLVYTSITGFGHTGPFAHLKSYEAVVMAKTGSLYGNIVPGRPGEPVMATPFGASIAGALLAIQGTLLALHQRERNGLGQRVDATLVQGMLAQDPWSYILRALAERYADAFVQVGAPSPGRPVPTGWLSYGLLNGYTKDGRWLQFAHATPPQYEAFLRACGLEALSHDPEWVDVTGSDDDAKRDEWWSMMLEAVRSRTVAEWQAVFDVDKDVFAEVYRSGLEVFEHPQVVHDGHVSTVEHPALGPVREIGVLVKMAKTPGSARRGVPELDQHGAELRSRGALAGSSAAASSAGAHPPAARSAGPDAGPPLQGTLVIDLGTFYAGPFGSAMLADQGAEVIKIEPLSGDPIRFQTAMPEATAVRVTQGKKSVAVDVFTDDGKAIVLELVRRADIVLHTYRGGVAERMGLDADTITALNPDLVYHHGVGYGVDGPYARRAAFAPTIAAGSGFARRSGGGGPEGRDLTLDEVKDATLQMGGVQPGHPDGMAALGVAVGMLLGLYARDRGAGGQITMTTMLSTMGHVLSDSLVEYDGAPAPFTTDADGYGFSALYRLYQAEDGWIVLCAPDDRDFEVLASALTTEPDLPEASGFDEDSRFATAAGRREHGDELAAALAATFARRSAAHWEAALSRAGVGCAEVSPSQGGLAVGLFAKGGVCDQLGMLTTVHHPIFDEVPRTTELVQLSHGRSTLGTGCTIGEHTDQVLRSFLGYDQARIDDLRTRGIIGG